VNFAYEYTHSGHNLVAGGYLALLSLFGMVMFHAFLDQFEEGAAHVKRAKPRFGLRWITWPTNTFCATVAWHTHQPAAPQPPYSTPSPTARSAATSTAQHPSAQWPKTAIRVTFGVIWPIDAILKWLPGFRSGYMDELMGQSDGQPGWLHGWFSFWINLQHPRVTFFAYLVAVVETLIALALITGFARKLTYAAAIVFSLLIWSTAEGFGGPYTSGSADIGTAIIYALVFAGLQLLPPPLAPQRRLLPRTTHRLVAPHRRGRPRPPRVRLTGPHPTRPDPHPAT